MNYNPLEVEVLRGTHIESRHLVHGVIFHADSQKLEVFGDESLGVYPRSTVKPLQAIPLITSGAAQQFSVSMQELALACASHRGETIHTVPIREWLKRIGLNESALECGVHPPSNQDSLYELIGSKNQPDSVHNNCSGKHTGMLTTAVHLGEPIKDYVKSHHPVQTRILKILETFCKTSITNDLLAIDGCSIPTPFLPLQSLAQCFAEFSNPHRMADHVAEACKLLFTACTKYPYLTAGTGHFCSEAMRASKEKVLIKGGAEGVIVASIPDLKLGMAFKARDGSSRAAEFCMGQMLVRLGLISAQDPLLNSKIRNWNQIETGFLRLKS